MAASDLVTKQIKAAREAPEGQPAGRAGVGGARAPSASRPPTQGRDTTRRHSTYTAKGKQRAAAGQRTAWDRYLALKPASRTPTSRACWSRPSGPPGWGGQRRAVGADGDRSSPEARSSGRLRPATRRFAYAAGQTRKGDLAAGKAVDLAPEDQRDLSRTTSRRAKGRRPSTTSAAPPPRPRRRADAATLHDPRPCSSTGRAADS